MHPSDSIPQPAMWWVADLNKVRTFHVPGYPRTCPGEVIPSGEWFFPALGRTIHFSEGILFEHEADAFKFVKTKTEEDLMKKLDEYREYLKKGAKFSKHMKATKKKKTTKPKSK